MPAWMDPPSFAGKRLGRVLPYAALGALAFGLLAYIFMLVAVFVWAEKVLLWPRPLPFSLMVSPILLAWSLGWAAFFFLLALYSWWAWRGWPRRRRRRWIHRWLAALLAGWALSFIPLVPTLWLWWALLPPPWREAVVGTTGLGYVLAWALPLLAPRLAGRLAFALWLPRPWQIALLPAAPVAGAMIGLRGGDYRIWLVVLVSAAISLGMAAFTAGWHLSDPPWRAAEKAPEGADPLEEGSG
jgi:hypothetical protein